MPAFLSRLAERPALPLPLRVLLVVLITPVAFLIYRRCSSTFPINTDYSNLMLEGDTMLHGNPLLSNWYLTTVSWYTTDIPLFALGIALRGFNPVLMRDIPTLVFLGVLAVSLWLASRPREDEARGSGLIGAAITFALLGLPSDVLATHLLMGPFRTGMVLLALLAYAALDTLKEKEDGRVPIVRLLLFSVPLTLALITDEFTQYIVVAPILLVTGLRLWRGPQEGRKVEIAILSATVATVLVAKITLKLLGAAGGFVMPDTYSNHIRIIPLLDLGRNLAWSVEGFQMIYSNNFWGMELGLPALFRILSGVSLVLVVYVMARVLFLLYATARATPAAPVVLFPLDRISSYLALGMTMNLLAYSFSTLPIGLATNRYFAPVAIFGAVLAGRLYTRRLLPEGKLRRWFPYLALLAAALSFVIFVKTTRRPHADRPLERVGLWLEARNLHDGYGGYWSTSDITVLTNKRVRVRQIIATEGGFKPFLFAADKRWYDAPAYFVVIDQRDFGGVNPKSVRAAFGEPDLEQQMEGHTIFVYNRNLATLLKREPEPARTK